MSIVPKARKPYYGVGINDAEYVTQPRSRSLRCPYFDVWHSMIRRCYSPNSLIRNKSYATVSVHKDWHRFSNFLPWIKDRWEVGYSLDKDLIVSGILYSPENCIMIPKYLNGAITTNLRGEYPLGVSLKFHNGREKPFISQIISEGRKVHLGVFSCPQDAHRAWQTAKVTELIRFTGKYQAEVRVDPKVLEEMRRMILSIKRDIYYGIETSGLTRGHRNP